MEPVGDLPANALPPGWSAGGAGGARDPEAAQRQAQQVLLVLYPAIHQAGRVHRQIATISWFELGLLCTRSTLLLMPFAPQQSKT